MVKLLVCGSVQGRHQILLERLKKLQNSNHGPFDMLLCVGKMFASREEFEAVAPTLLLPMATITGDDDNISGGDELPPNLRFLKNGLQDLCGLSVFFAGNGVTAAESRISGQADGVLDILITPDWPRDMHHFLDEQEVAAIRGLQVGLGAGSAEAAHAAAVLCPRYHFAGGRAAFYQRPPYFNRVGMPCTRLVALAPVSESKAKTQKVKQSVPASLLHRSFSPLVEDRETELRTESPFSFTLTHCAVFSPLALPPIIHSGFMPCQ